MIGFIYQSISTPSNPYVPIKVISDLKKALCALEDPARSEKVVAVG